MFPPSIIYTAFIHLIRVRKDGTNINPYKLLIIIVLKDRHVASPAHAHCSVLSQFQQTKPLNTQSIY